MEYPGLEAEMKLILHIGAPKTGTTQLQAVFSKNSAALNDDGILYPKTGRVFGNKSHDRHIGLRFACEPIKKPANGMMAMVGLDDLREREKYSESFWSDLKSEINSSKGVHTVIMSDEALLIFSNKEMVKKLSEKANEIFSEIVVFSSFRRPGEYLSSSYSQAVKMGSYETWEEYLRKFTKDPESNTMFERKLSIWKNNIDCKNFIVRPMAGDSVEQFSKYFGINSSLEVKTKEQNKSLSYIGVQVLRRVNEIIGEGGKRPPGLRGAFEKMATGKKWKPSGDDLNRIDKAFENEIIRISNAFNIPDQDMELVNSWFNQENNSNINPEYSISDDHADEIAKIILENYKK